MPGIAGIIAPLKRESLQAAVSDMSAALLCGEGCSTHAWVGEWAGMMVASGRIKGMLAVDRDGSGITLAVTGQVAQDGLFRERLAGVARSAPLGQDSLADQLLRFYKKFGPVGLQSLNGSYAAAAWEALPRRLTLVTDRAGLQPVYYWQNGKELVFSSRVQAISSLPGFRRVIDPVAVFDLLAAEQMLDERTLFRDIQALPPAGLLTFENGRLDVRSYWQPVFYVPGGRDPGEAEAIDGLAERVLSAVHLLLSMLPAGGAPAGSMRAERENSPSTVALPAAALLLTGGLDSRLLAGALARSKKDLPVAANTIGHEQARDVRYGREIARVTGLPYTVLPANPRYLVDYAADFVRRTEGGSNVHASWILEELGYLAQARIPAVFTGVGAEAISGRHWLAEQPVTTRAEALERLCAARWTYARAAELLRFEIRAEAQHASRESLRRTLEEAPSDSLPGWSDYFAFRQNRRHPTGNVLSGDVLVLEPYFENELVDYAYGLPPALRNQGMLYKKMIVERFPELAGIGYTDSGLLLSNEISGYSIPARVRLRIHDFRRRARNRLGRNLPFLRGPVSGDRPAQAIYYNHWLRTSARNFVLSLLHQEDLYADYLDAARVRNLVEGHMSGRVDEFRLVNAVVTFALWRKIYDRS